MVILESALVDTNILIKAYRGDKTKQLSLKHPEDKYCIPVITACELIKGKKTLSNVENLVGRYLL